MENLIVDSEVFSDLEPLTAPEWSLRVEMMESPVCLLGEYLTRFLQITYNHKTLIKVPEEDVTFTSSEDQALSSAFNIFTETKIPSITSVVSRNASKARKKNVEGPISEDILFSILHFLFPVLDVNKVSQTIPNS